MIVLDSHAWVWWANESAKLSKRASDVIGSADSVGICAISCWEVAMLVAKQRLTLRQDVSDWIRLALARPPVQLIPLEPEIAVLSTRLPGDFHGDPADRLIVASCLCTGATLVTKDEQIRAWGRASLVW